VSVVEGDAHEGHASHEDLRAMAQRAGEFANHSTAAMPRCVVLRGAVLLVPAEDAHDHCPA
jgi:hypothetical protein